MENMISSVEEVDTVLAFLAFLWERFLPVRRFSSAVKRGKQNETIRLSATLGY